MTCFVFEVKKMRAEISDPEPYSTASEMVWSSSYDLFCVRGLKKMRAEIPFKMSAGLPSETAWSSSYDLFCVFILPWPPSHRKPDLASCVITQEAGSASCVTSLNFVNLR